ncbi:hypothetical protein ACEUZ9_001574 [Paracoccus litorisediminis]|uniref:hypothetical protein n=1 Tax=Paracoccus litorisediminis TaxID=2006130 RepID=UPI003731987C
MELIDADWIKHRLTGKRGELTELARAVGVKPDVISKILKGERRVQPGEMALIVAFFRPPSKAAPDPLEQRLLDRIQELTDEERALLLGAAEGLIAHRQVAKR